MNKLKVEFHQEGYDERRPDRYQLFIERITDEDFHPIWLKCWASIELKQYFDLYIVMNLDRYRFNLNKPVFAKVYFNDEVKLNLVQVRVSRDRILRKGIDYVYKVLSCEYLLIPEHEFPNRVKKKTSKVKFETVNLDRLFNAIEFESRAKVKYASPLLYTAMRS
jgi:predicted RNA-binding protein